MDRIYILMGFIALMMALLLFLGIFIGWDQVIIQIIIQIVLQSIIWRREIRRWWRRMRQGQHTTTTTRRIREDLNPVEAAVVLDYNQEDVIKMIVFLLVKKKVLKVKEQRPKIKLEKIAELPVPKYYEQQVMNAIRSDGTLDTFLLSSIYQSLRWETNTMMREYDFDATKNFYRDRIRQKMESVEASNIQLE